MMNHSVSFNLLYEDGTQDILTLSLEGGRRLQYYLSHGFKTMTVDGIKFKAIICEKDKPKLNPHWFPTHHIEMANLISFN